MPVQDTKSVEAQVLEPLQERAEQVAAQLKEKLAPVDNWIRTVARERPLLLLAGALGTGYLIGRLIRRI